MLKKLYELECPLDGVKIIPALQGKTIYSVMLDRIDGGYSHATFSFTDGTSFEILEHSQTGEFKASMWEKVE